MDLTRNTILITGGTSGFGLAFAKKLLEMGNTVIVTGRDETKIDAIRKDYPGIHVFKSDVSDADAIEKLYNQVIDQFPSLNMLINNAGEMRIISLHDISFNLQDVTREIEINLMGPIRMVQQFLPILKNQKSATILNVSSGLAVVPFPISPIYSAAKSGLHAYTRTLRVQLKNTSVQVFELLAPASKTPLNDKFVNIEGFTDSGSMAPEKVVEAALEAMKKNNLEIYPGMARLLYMFSRIAPGFIFKQMSKIGAKQMVG